MIIQLIRRKIKIINNENQYTIMISYLLREKETNKQIKYPLFNCFKKLVGRGYILNNIIDNEVHLDENCTILFEYNVDYAL